MVAFRPHLWCTSASSSSWAKIGSGKGQRQNRRNWCLEASLSHLQSKTNYILCIIMHIVLVNQRLPIALKIANPTCVTQNLKASQKTKLTSPSSSFAVCFFRLDGRCLGFCSCSQVQASAKSTGVCLHFWNWGELPSIICRNDLCVVLAQLKASLGDIKSAFTFT